MESNELRIGNYIYDPINKENVKLVAIEQGNRPITLGCKGTSSFSGFDCLKPIQLTEEILLKCGFEKVEHENGDYFDFELFMLKILDTYFSCVYGKQRIEYELKYLHQLQNIYFALTNEELTVNL